MSDNPSAKGFCVGCGLAMTTAWDFCPRCGAKRVEVETPGAKAPAKYSRTTEMRLEVKGLIDKGRLDEAEALVRRELMRDRSLEVLLVAADVLSRRLKVNEAAEVLEEATALAPDNYLVYIRRAEHLGRIGMFPQALEDTKTARRLIPAGDVPAMVYCQELDRVFTDRSRGSFVRGSSVPRFAAGLRGLRKRDNAPQPEALQMEPEVR